MTQSYCIADKAEVIEALRRLNEVFSHSMTLFVVDEQHRMVGTLTDGDIRRHLIDGGALSAPVAEAMKRDFSYLGEKEDIARLKQLRDRGIELVPRLDGDKRIIEIIDLSKRRSALPVDAVLMAGGKGERLRPLTLTTPKPLLKIGDRCIIDRNVDSLIDYGVKNISVTVNYLKEQLKEHYQEPRSGVKVDCVEEERFLGTIGALTLVREFKNDTILVMNSDLLTDIDFEDFYLHFREHDAMMAAAAIPYTISVPYGIFELEGREIKGVSEKPVYNYFANAGIYLIRKEALSFIPDGEMFNATDLIDALARAGERVVRYPLSGLWIDIGTPEEYHKAQDLIKHLRN